jgi:hypothetical protein
MTPTFAFDSARAPISGLDSTMRIQVQSLPNISVKRWSNARQLSPGIGLISPEERRNTVMAALATTPTVESRARGRGYFWAGIAACLLGPALVAAQFQLQHLIVPWYSPVLATLGVFLLLAAVFRRRSVPRLIALVLVAAFAGLQWYFLAVLMKLPEYAGPARAGEPIPAFHSTLADGQPFTEADLRDGSRHALIFFRGRW